MAAEIIQRDVELRDGERGWTTPPSTQLARVFSLGSPPPTGPLRCGAASPAWVVRPPEGEARVYVHAHVHVHVHVHVRCMCM